MFRPSVTLSFRLIACVLLLFAIPPLLFGGWAYSRSKAFVAKADSTSGEVIELIEVNGSEGGSTYSPRVRFLDKSGSTIEATSSTSSYPPEYQKGEQVEILYNPDKPQDFKTSDWFSMWGGSIIGFSMAGVTPLNSKLIAFLGPIIYKGFTKDKH